ncbi:MULTISPECIES: hypothetical protein [Comamonas]|uniref:Uncharacterized protein n=1 Tax=Comamonas testosteroni TaxID=285 RepID=A0A096FKW7_COMTE|nr:MULTISPECIES: hypothetical protein [Comamonas]KGH30554.1 hypothetical protein P353_09885 [Comamonas testosteroni]
MILYSHLTTEQLTARRDSYMAAIDPRLLAKARALLASLSAWSSAETPRSTP